MVRPSESLDIPQGVDTASVDAGGYVVELTNLQKVFWPQLRATKGDLLRYYASIARWLVPHARGKPTVLKRYPNGIAEDFFFMKRAPANRPAWIQPCRVGHASGSVIDFVTIDSLASLLWVINLGCIDLNPWPAPCSSPDRPGTLAFDLDPNEAPFSAVSEAATVVRDAVTGLGMRPFVKTSGASGIHVFVPIVPGPTQKDVWRASKAIGLALCKLRPDLLTAEYPLATRPRNRVLVDYNQNAYGRTLASIYSVRPTETATVSTPLEWDEVEAGIEPEAFDMASVPARLERVGDLWAPLLGETDRFRLDTLKGSALAV